MPTTIITLMFECDVVYDDKICLLRWFNRRERVIEAGDEPLDDDAESVRFIDGSYFRVRAMREKRSVPPLAAA